MNVDGRVFAAGAGATYLLVLLVLLLLLQVTAGLRHGQDPACSVPWVLGMVQA
jgi:hypothetical protein